MGTLQLQLFDNIVNNEPLALRCLEKSKKTRTLQEREFMETHDREHDRRIRMPIPERVKLLAQCMQIRDRIDPVSPQDRMEVMRLILKLDVEELLQVEALKKFKR